MINAGNLLGQLLGSGISNSGMDRMGHAMGPQGLGRQGNPLAAIFGGGQGGGGLGELMGGGSRGGGLGGLGDMLGGLLGGATGAVKRGDPMAMGGRLGALAGAVLGGGSMSSALKGGGMALLGTLAVSALRNWNQGGAAPSSPEDFLREAPVGVRPPATPTEHQELEDSALLVLKGMINAAKADGKIDGAEMQRIVEKLKKDGISEEERAFLESELNKPLDIDGLVRQVKTPEVAVQIYAASLLAIEVDTAAEKDYMRRLAQGLGLNQQTLDNVHELLGVA